MGTKNLNLPNPQLVVDLFNNSYDKNSNPMSLEGVAKLVKEDSGLECFTKLRRKLLADAGNEENEELKSKILKEADAAKLGAKTIGVAFHMAGGKEKSCCTTPTWLTLFELDFHDGSISEEKRMAVMETIRADKHLLLHHESISGGGGSHNLVSYRVPEDVANMMVNNPKYAENLYKRIFKSINDYYARLIGIAPDYSCSNINRTLVLAHDKNALFNPNAEPFEFTKEDLCLNEDCSLMKMKPGPKTKNVSGNNDAIQTIVSYVQDILDKSGCKFESHNHNNYVFGFVNRLNEFGVTQSTTESIVTDLFSGKMTDDPLDIVARVYNSESGKDRHGSILTDKKGRVTNMQMAEHLVTALASFRVNTITRQLQIRNNDLTGEGKNFEWEVFEDRHFNTLYTKVIKLGASVNSGDFRSLLLSEEVSPDFDPVKEYTSKLKPWDPTQTDYIQDVIDHLILSDKENEKVLNQRLYKWIVQFVAHVIGIESEHQYVVSLIGPQNTGKTHIWKNFLPKELEQYFDTIDLDELKKKDGMIKMTINLLLLFDEIKISGAASNSFKAITSKVDINLRVPYGRFVENRKRLASFCATSNDFQYIAEREGDRRLVTIEIEGTKNLDEHPLNIDGMFAQAIYLINDGSEYNYTREEVADISAYNEKYLVCNLTESGIIKLYRNPAIGERGTSMVNTADIISDFKQNGYYDPSVTAESIGRAMSHLGFRKERKTHGVVYHVYYNSQMSITNR